MKQERYSIRDFKIVDAQGDPVPEIYIRELLDMGSHEFRSSKLNAQQKLEIIDAIGYQELVGVLEECFRATGKSYSAATEAELAMIVLKKTGDRR